MKTWQTWIWILVVGVAWIFALRQALVGAWTISQIVGMAVAVPAFCLWALARLQLGKSFSISAQAKGLVTHGLYSKIQNPVYVFGGIFIAAVMGMANRSPTAPHNDAQSNNDMVTASGFSCRRLPRNFG